MAQKKPSSYSGQPALKKHTPTDASGKGQGDSRTHKVKRHTPQSVSGSGGGNTSGGHPYDGMGRNTPRPTGKKRGK